MGRKAALLLFVGAVAPVSASAFCVDGCCPETAIPRLLFSADERWGDEISLRQNGSRGARCVSWLVL
jgi:hypothetical protein